MEGLLRVGECRARYPGKGRTVDLAQWSPDSDSATRE